MRGTPGEKTIVKCKMCGSEFETKFLRDRLPERTRCNNCSRKLKNEKSTGGGITGSMGSLQTHKPRSKMVLSD